VFSQLLRSLVLSIKNAKGRRLGSAAHAGRTYAKYWTALDVDVQHRGQCATLACSSHKLSAKAGSQENANKRQGRLSLSDAS